MNTNIVNARRPLVNGHGTGWKRQLPDHRDRYYNLEEKILTSTQLAPTGGIAPSHLPPIWDQLQLGSCVPHGTLRAFLTEAMKQGLSLPMLSRLFVYAKGRDIEGTPLSDDSGMEVRDGIKVLANYGAPPESEWPYSDANPGPFQREPSMQATADAKKHMAVKYQQIIVGSPGAPIRTALSRGLAITYGFPVPDYFEDGSWDPASEQPLPIPGPNTQYIGGHCVTATFYNFSGSFISTPTTNRRVAPYLTNDNSWSASWGMAGRFNIDAEWFNPTRQLASDLWVVQQDT